MRILVDALFGVRDADHPEQLDRALPWPGALFMPMCSFSDSLIWRLIVSTGLSDVIGSWKIMAISLPRIDRTCSSDMLEDVVALEHDFARDDLAGRAGDQAHDRQAGHALAAAGFADDAERLTRHHVEGNIVDGLHHAILGHELGLEILDFQNGSGMPICAVGRAGLGLALGDHARSSLARWVGGGASNECQQRPCGVPLRPPTPGLATGRRSRRKL